MALLLDFDGDGLTLVRAAYELARNEQVPRNNQCTRDYKIYTGYVDPMYRDPDRANVFIPKIFNIVNVKSAKDLKTLLGIRPYIPIEAKRKEFREMSRLQGDVLDDLLEKAGFYEKMATAAPIKNLYGTAFLEALPYYEQVIEKQVIPENIMGRATGRFQIKEVPVPRLRLRITPYAPWEIYIDPRATGLEAKGQCRFVIKMQLVSKREIIKMAEGGAYGGFDIAKLDETPTGSDSDHWGKIMLQEIGLSQNQDDDTGVLMRYESEERYIDVWNGVTTLREMENPFKHKLINLSRWIHRIDPHTQNKFWGIGESKPNEILQAMLNDTWNLTLNTHEMADQLTIYFREGAVNPNLLVRTPGNRVPVSDKNDKPIGDSIVESSGPGLPPAHYIIPETLERMMDLTANLYDINRGEPSQKTEQTATEAALLKEAGEGTQELNVRLGEHVLLADFGMKCLYHIDQFATVDDIVEIVGQEGAMVLATLNPMDLPGGFNFSFKGSDKATNEMVKQRNWKELVPILLTIPNVLPGWLATKLLEVYNIADKDIAEGVIPDAIMIQLQMAMGGQQQAPGKKENVNNQKSEGQNSAKVARGAK